MYFDFFFAYLPVEKRWHQSVHWQQLMIFFYQQLGTFVRHFTAVRLRRRKAAECGVIRSIRLIHCQCFVASQHENWRQRNRERKITIHALLIRRNKLAKLSKHTKFLPQCGRTSFSSQRPSCSLLTHNINCCTVASLKYRIKQCIIMTHILFLVAYHTLRHFIIKSSPVYSA